jgi:hypothetical protein
LSTWLLISAEIIGNINEPALKISKFKTRAKSNPMMVEDNL